MNESLIIYNQELEPIKNENNNIINEFINQLKSKDFTIDNIQEAINKTKEITNTSGKELFMTIRKATTNLEHGPELAKTIFLFGKEKIYYRYSFFNFSSHNRKYNFLFSIIKIQIITNCISCKFF